MRFFASAIVFCSLISSLALGADYSVEAIADPPPADMLSKELAGSISSQGFRLSKGSRVFCEVWLANKWNAKADFAPTAETLYPLETGELIGVARYKSKGTDFRGQQVPTGLYTLRYALQPVDGNHVGTSDTRDFLLLIPVDSDESPAPISEEKLFELSPKTVGTTHPAMLSLIAVAQKADSLPAVEHHEEEDRWSVQFAGKTTAAGDASTLVLDLILVGRAKE